MKSLSSTAKTIDIICKIAFSVCISVAIVIAVVVVIMALGGESIISDDGIATLTLGSVEFEIANEYFPDLSMSKSFFCLTFGLTALSLIIAAYFCKFVQKIVKPLIEQKPFDGTLSKNIKKLAYFSLIGGGIYSLLSMLGQYLILKWFDVENLFISEKIVGLNIENELDTTFVFIFVLLYMLSIVFKYGEELQKESDETL